jgi:hypothetical protein
MFVSNYLFCDSISSDNAFPPAYCVLKIFQWVNLITIFTIIIAPSACVGVAYSISHMGYFLGSLLCVIITFSAALGSLLLLSVLGHSGQRTMRSLPDIGEFVGGKYMKLFGLLIQQTNFVLFLPVAM